MNFDGIIIGLSTFLVIGLFHPLVIKAEYYLGLRSKWLFVLSAIVFLAASLFVQHQLVSILCGVISFSSVWSIKEVYDQRKRVLKGWFPKNPARLHDYENAYGEEEEI